MRKNTLLSALWILVILIGGVSCKTNFISQRNSNSYGGNFPEKTSSKPKVAAQEVPSQVDNNAVETAIEGSAPAAAPENPTVQTSRKPRKSFLQAIPQRKYTDTGAAPQPDQLPMEKNASIGFWMVIGSLVGAFIPYVGFLAFFTMIAGFILGIVGLSNIKKNPGKYRGRGKAIAAIVIPAVSLVLGIIIFALLILAFATL
jgi:hypothetical protein